MQEGKDDYFYVVGSVIMRQAHRNFLTGFHKRKLQKKEDAKKKAVEREKQERLDARREVRLFSELSNFEIL